jgi:hypothetical protein
VTVIARMLTFRSTLPPIGGPPQSSPAREHAAIVIQLKQLWRSAIVLPDGDRRPMG